MEKLLNNFDNKIIDLLCENSSEFFEQQMTIEDAEEIYKHSFKQSKSESKMSLSINKKLSISDKSPPIIIAEISGNHGGKKSLFQPAIGLAELK